jgi:Cytochrome c7 and related cytochrome c
MRAAGLQFRPLALAMLSFVVFAVSPPSVAAAPLTTQDCLTCHNMTPTASENAKRVPLFVNQKLFHSSVHFALGCTACHSDVKAFPHTPAPRKVECGNCHSEQAAAFAKSVHASAAAGEEKLKYPACLTCHGNPHGIVEVKDPGSPVYPLNLPRTCGRCHGSPALAKRYGFPNVYQLYIDSIHGFALTKDGLLVAATCASCHGSHLILSRKNPDSRTYRTNIPATCGTCHAGVEAKYYAGVHGKALKAGNDEAPVCTNCHTVHRIARVQTAAFQVTTVATCGRCHKEHLRSYRDTFHGQVTELGFVATARCWSCHGNHLILPASNPRSSIAPRNLIHTCSKCHKDVTASFVTYQPHPNPRDEALNPSLYYSTRFMNLLLLVVFAFFGLHTLLWLVRSWFAERRRSRFPPSRPPKG